MLFGGKDNGMLDQLKITDDDLMKEGAITKDKFQSFNYMWNFAYHSNPPPADRPRQQWPIPSTTLRAAGTDSFSIEQTAKNDCGCL